MKTVIVPRIPIFITVRGHNKETIKCNREALKFAYIFIKEQDLFGQTYIISDNKSDILDYATKLGFTNTIHYPCKSNKDLRYLEYLATYRYGTEHNYRPDWIILLNINQLFLSSILIVDCIRNIDDKYDIIASYTEISNRSHFFVENLTNNENNLNKHLLSSEHDRVKMVDAAIYAIKTDFAYSCMEYDDPAKKFWNGKIKYFKNNGVYTDIYTIDDIHKYYNITNILVEAQKI